MQRRGWGTKLRTVTLESRVPHIYWNAFTSARHQSRLANSRQLYKPLERPSFLWGDAWQDHSTWSARFILYIFFFSPVLSLMIRQYSSSELPRCWDLATSPQKICRCRKLKWTQYNYYNRVLWNSHILDQKAMFMTMCICTPECAVVPLPASVCVGVQCVSSCWFPQGKLPQCYPQTKPWPRG